MAKATKPTPPNADTLVKPSEVAPSGHGGSAPAPVPHPLTPEANVEPAPSELSNPENNVIADEAKDDK